MVIVKLGTIRILNNHVMGRGTGHQIISFDYRGMRVETSRSHSIIERGV